MKEIKEESKLLASLAVFRELYDKQEDIYGVIAEYLKEIITSERKYKFNLTEISNLLNNTFEFSIPDAVVSTALRRLDFLRREQGFYLVTNMPNAEKGEVSGLQEEKLADNATLVSNLFSYIEMKNGSPLSDNEKIRIVHALYTFLLDETNGIEYSNYISAFILNGNNDVGFRNKLNKIREGVILYSGIKYNENLAEMGSWKTELTIYLDTEILFHFAGYNGQLYKSMFDVFLNYVKEINGAAKKVIINLEYFREVKIEIEKFFTKAECIISGKDVLNPRNTAMTSVIEGCRSPSDVIAKKSDFYRRLEANLIFENLTADYFDKSNHEYNFIDKHLVDNISKELNEDITENLNFLNYVSIQRKKANVNDFENIGYILLTGDSKTIRVAWHENVKTEGKVPLATTLIWITNRFWFKLNKGFGDGKFPKSFDVITKARMVLSSSLSKSIGSRYDQLLLNYKRGELTDESAKQQIITLRSQTRKPEEIQENEISSILGIISETSLAQYASEQEFSKYEAQKQSEENARLRLELCDKELAREREEMKTNEVKKELFLSLNRTLLGKKREKRTLESQQKVLDQKSKKKFGIYRFFVGLVFGLFCLIQVCLIKTYGWDVYDQLKTILTAILAPLTIFVYLLVFDKEWSWKPKEFLKQKEEYFKRQTYKEFKFDTVYLENLNKEIYDIEKLIETKKQ